MTDGNRASKDGRAAEGMVANLLNSRGYSEIEQDSRERKLLNKFIKEGGDPLTCLSELGGNKVFVRQCVGYPTIYGKPARHDFLVQGGESLTDGLIIEVKWQSVGGSVDEKYPFVAASFKALSQMTCLVLDGGGATDKAIEWVKAQEDKRFLVFRGIGSFINWMRKHG